MIERTDTKGTPQQLALEEPLGIFDALAGYCQAYDSRDRSQLEQIFSPDATLRVTGGRFKGESAVGRAAALAWLTRNWATAPPSMHLTGNTRLKVSDEGATGISDYLFVVKDPQGAFQITSAGEYLDKFRREDGRWVIAERIITGLGEPVDPT